MTRTLLLSTILTLALTTLLAGCARKNMTVTSKPSTFKLVKEADGSCTVSTVVSMKTGKEKGSMMLTSNKPTCAEAKADLLAGIEAAKKNN